MTTKRGLPAIIVSSEPSVWGSCRVITPNLERAYHDAFQSNANYFSYTTSMAEMDIWQLARQIHKSKPERLIFIDHAPHPDRLLKALALQYGKQPLPPLYFHVYGDFTLYALNWLQTDELLKRTRVHFVCASHRQVELVSRMVTRPIDVVSRCHFPVDAKIYHYSPELRRHWREKLQVADDEFLILYTGRLSLQKNTLMLLKEFERLWQATSLKARLVIAGGFDDLGAPFFGIHLGRGFYQAQWSRAMTECEVDPGLIRYLGNFGPEDLRGIYNAADTYFSLSLHHDEDFGMSPAEALCTGTTAVLSDWGGYASFREPGSRDCHLVPVTLEKLDLSMASSDVSRALMLEYLRHSAGGDAERESRSKRYIDSFSIGAATEIIKNLHKKEPPKFLGFNRRMQRLVWHLGQHVPFPGGARRGGLYEEIYGAYLNTETQSRS